MEVDGKGSPWCHCHLVTSCHATWSCLLSVGNALSTANLFHTLGEVNSGGGKLGKRRWTRTEVTSLYFTHTFIITESKHIYFQYSDARQEKRHLCAQNCTMTSCYVTSRHVTLRHVPSLFTFSWQCFQHCLIYSSFYWNFALYFLPGWSE